MRRMIRNTLAALLCAVIPAASRAAEDPGPPIKALLIVGGCCHDYGHQKDAIPDGVSARANVQWKVAYDPIAATNHLNPIYANKDWYKGFDVIVHDECSADVKDLDVINNAILAPHKDGLPAVVLHCGMHCYRSEGWPEKMTPWFEFTGLQTTGHGAQLPIALTFLDKENEITKGMEDWTTIKEELYNNIAKNVLPTAHPLIRGKQSGKKAGQKDHFDNDTIVAWTNEYGPKKTRVFGTTLGHNTETVKDDRYLDLITRGLLWSVGKLDAEHLKPAKKVFIDGPEASAQPVKAAPAMEDLAHGKTATASSFQEENGNTPDQAFDGVESSRWCASDGRTPQWLQVDLGKPQNLTGARIFWEFDGHNYQYKISGSVDGKNWETLSDQTRTKSIDQEQTAKFAAKKIRYVKLDVVGVDPGTWASVSEFNVYGAHPAGAAAKGKEKYRNFNSGEVKADPSKILAGVKGPKGFDVTVFAAPPDVSYVTCIAATPTGELFIGVDKDGSLGRDPGAGKIVFARDADGDGRADKFITFAAVDHPRGLIWDDGKLYVLHPPTLGVFKFKPDGTAGPEKILVDGITNVPMLNARGADHTTNGIRLGIDGWIYIAMGDYGAIKATGADGKTLQEHGGGIMRVRTDGSDLEIYSHGHRNIYDVAIDPFMNVFTRDNTNDGDNWNDRLAYVVPTGYYGYPSYFMHFPGEFVDCLADYGGGSPCGSIFIDEPTIGTGLYTVEWGNSEVDRHPLTPNGAGFKGGFEKFMTLPRGTDIDVDGRGNMYVSSWANGGFAYSGPNVGYVLRISRPGGPVTMGMLGTDEELLQGLTMPSAVHRQAAQRKILRRGYSPFFAKGLEELALSNGSEASFAAAIFTIKLLNGPDANASLMRIAEKEPDVREFALRALADRKNDASVDPAPFIKALSDPNPRVRLVAAWGLGRLGRRDAISSIVPLLADKDLLVAHVAMQSLVALHATKECLGMLDESHPSLVLGVVRVLQHFHEPAVVDGLLDKLQAFNDSPIRNFVFGGLARLYHKEADWDGQWWGTRPDTTGPYYKPVTWECTSQIGSALASAIKSAKGDDLKLLVAEVQRNGVDAPEVNSAVATVGKSNPAIKAMLIEALIARPTLNDEQVETLRGVAISEDETMTTRVKAIHALQRAADAGNATAMNAVVNVVVGVLKNDSAEPQLAAAMMEFVRDFSHGEQIAYFADLVRKGDSAAKRELGYAVLLNLSTSRLVKSPQRKEAMAEVDAGWSQPSTAVALLRAIGLLKDKDYAQKVAALKKDERSAVAQTAAEVYPLIAASSESGGTMIENMPYEAVVAAAQKDRGDAKLGADLFARQGCIACHTTSPAETPKGPMLGGITKRYSRAELCESILKPNAKIAQGFETQWFKTGGETVEGFVVHESGDSIELRNASGIATTIKKSQVTSRGKRETSVMPERLVAKLTPHDLASILAYLDSLSGK